MKTKLATLLLATTFAGFAAPVLATSSYGPAPLYRPSLDAPAAHRGQFGVRIADAGAALTARHDAVDTADTERASTAIGGAVDTVSQSGGPTAFAAQNKLFAHH